MQQCFSRSSIRVILVVVIVLAAVAVLFVLRSIPALTTIVQGVRAAEQHLSNARAAWERDGYRGAATAEVELGRAVREISRTIDIVDSQALLRLVPGGNRFLDDVASTAQGARSLAQGLRMIAAAVAMDVAIFDRYAATSIHELDAQERAAILEAFGETATAGRRALQAFAQTEAERGVLRCAGFIAVVVPACRSTHLGQAQEAIGVVRGDIALAVDVADRVVQLMGGDSPQSILILFLNNTELRPGGGFLGTYGLATVHRGTLIDFQTDDVYQLDRNVIGTQQIAPPVPLRRHGIVSSWYLRDANWSPDFPTSTKTVLDFYEREQGPGNPGIVLGFTPELAARLLTLVGPVTVNGITFDAATATDVLEEEVEITYVERGIPREDRKAIITPLSSAVLNRLFDLPLRDWVGVADVLRGAAHERHLMAYSRDPALQHFFVALDLDGAVRPLPDGSDGLLVVDANLGALKTDPVVERSIHYAIIPDGDGFRGTVQLHYRNTGTFSWRTTRYRTYTRVYLPLGTELIRAHGAMVTDRSVAPGVVDVDTELGRTVVGVFLSVEPGEERTLALEIRLAPRVVARIHSGSYELLAQKQLGSSATRLTLRHELGTPLRAAEPPEAPPAWGDSQYVVEADLRWDRQFTVTLQR